MIILKPEDLTSQAGMEPVNRTVLLRATLPMLGRTLCHATAAAWVLGREEELTCTATGVYYVKH